LTAWLYAHPAIYDLLIAVSYIYLIFLAFLGMIVSGIGLGIMLWWLLIP